jgi:hypothetical protein
VFLTHIPPSHVSLPHLPCLSGVSVTHTTLPPMFFPSRCIFLVATSCDLNPKKERSLLTEERQPSGHVKLC